MTNVRLFSVRFFQIYLWQSIEKKRKFLYVQLVQVKYTNFTIYAHSTDFDRGMVHIAQEQLSRCHIECSTNTSHHQRWNTVSYLVTVPGKIIRLSIKKNKQCWFHFNNFSALGRLHQLNSVNLIVYFVRKIQFLRPPYDNTLSCFTFWHNIYIILQSVTRSLDLNPIENVLDLLK